MVHYKISPLEDKGVPGMLRFFYIAWNTLLTIILAYSLSNSNNFGVNQKAFIFVGVSLLITYISFLFGVRLKFWLTGMVDTSHEVKSRISWKVFLPALVSQFIAMLFNTPSLGAELQFSFVIIALLMFIWSSFLIKIEFHAKVGSNDVTLA